MKAEPAAQLALVDLQAHDSALAQIAARRKNLPEHGALTELEQRLGELDSERIVADTAVGDLERSIGALETDIDQVRTRRLRDEDRLNSGAVTNPKDLESLQSEIVALDRRIGTLEDEQLEIMEELEAANATLSSVTEQISAAAAEREELTAKRDEQLAALAEEEKTVQLDRDDVAPRIPDDLMKLYDRLRDQHAGLGAAPLVRRRCEGCHLELTNSDISEIAQLAEDEVVRCPECSRILVRTIDSGL